jgi:hypothetical protein
VSYLQLSSLVGAAFVIKDSTQEGHSESSKAIGRPGHPKILSSCRMTIKAWNKDKPNGPGMQDGQTMGTLPRSAKTKAKFNIDLRNASW